MDELYASQVDIMATVDPRIRRTDLGGAAARPATTVFMTSPETEVFRVTTKSGYSIEATAWHRFHKGGGQQTIQGKSSSGVLTPLSQLNVGDRLWVLSGKGQFGPKGCEDLGLLLGLFTVQGLILEDDEGAVELVLPLWGMPLDKATEIQHRVSKLLTMPESAGAVSLDFDEAKNVYMLRSADLVEVLMTHGVLYEDRNRVPEVIWRGTKECVAAYLRTLIGTEGFLQLSDGHSSPFIKLAAREELLLCDVQVLLANFGIFSRRHCRTQASVNLALGADGNLEERISDSKFELYLARQGVKGFIKEIGMLHPADIRMSQEWLSRESKLHVPMQAQSAFEDEIISIQSIGWEPVYDVTQPDGASIVINGLATGNCDTPPTPQ